MGAKVSKKYDSAKTPFQRILLSDQICQAKKDSLTLEYETLDPVSLLAQMELLQDELWQYSWNQKDQSATELTVIKEDVIDHSVACVDDSQYPTSAHLLTHTQRHPASLGSWDRV